MMSHISNLRDQLNPQPKWDDAPPIIHEQPECWIYWNPHGQLVLRQRAEVFEDDPFLIFSVENISALIRALQAKLAEFYGSEDDMPEPQTEAKAGHQRTTNAERQRRYRNAHRNARNVDRNARDVPPGEDPWLFALER